MLRNYLKTAERSLRNDTVPTLINVSGLAVGMACCLWLLLFVEHEWSFDRFHDDADRIVRITQERVRGDGSVHKTALVPPPLGPVIEQRVPEAGTVVRLAERTITIRRDGTASERDVLFADPSFFDLFTFPLVAGDVESALAAPNQIVLTESEAQRLFGSDNPMGQSLTIAFQDEAREVQVSGIAEDPPTTSSIPFSSVMPMENVAAGRAEAFFDQWQMGLVRTYVRLETGADIGRLEQSVHRAVAARVADTAQEGSYGATATDPGSARFVAQPITEVHHATDISGGLVPPSDPRYAYIQGAIALFILLIAAINFVTLSLGRSAQRAREVGVRKSMGASPVQLGAQFWCEAMVVCGLALLVGLLLTRLFLPVFVDLADVPLQLSMQEQPLVWLGMAALVLTVGLIAGGYPAWVLAHKEAAPVLQGQHRAPSHGRLSQGLIVVQFALTIGLVASVLIMSHQLRYMTESDLGYADAPIVTMTPEGSRDEPGRFRAFKQEAERHPAVHAVTGSGVGFGSPGIAPVELRARSGDVVRAYFNPVDPDYIETMGLRVTAGRLFGDDDPSEGLLVNERLVAALGTEEPVGAMLPVHKPNILTKPLSEAQVVGVVEDHHVSSFEEEIPPVILTPPDLMPTGIHGIRTYSARLQTGQTEEGLVALSTTWETVFPDQPFEYAFLQDRIEGQYEAEQRWRTLVGYAALMALLIACFGLFGLAALEVSRRTPEIGIRKVLGASAPSLVALLSGRLVRLVGLGAFLAVPIAYVATERWLAHFAYRVEPAWWTFAVAGVATLLVALGTTLYHTLRAAWMDPVRAIREE